MMLSIKVVPAVINVAKTDGINSRAKSDIKLCWREKDGKGRGVSPSLVTVLADDKF